MKTTKSATTATTMKNVMRKFQLFSLMVLALVATLILIQVFVKMAHADSREHERGRHREIRREERDRDREHRGDHHKPELGHGREFKGEGCSNGTAMAAISPDGTSLSLIFDQFTAEAGGATGRKEVEKVCAALIPIEVPEGKTLVITNADYRGFISLPGKGEAEIKASYGTMGRKGSEAEGKFKDENDTDFMLSDKKSVILQSSCGGTLNFNVQVKLKVKTNEHRDTAMMSLDSADYVGRHGISYGISLKDCP